MDNATDKPMDKSVWRRAVAPYEGPNHRRSIGQILNSFLPYLALWVAMYWSLSVSYWLTLALAIPAAGFLIRIFIIAHDCGHGSFFRSRRASLFLGSVGAAMAFTPFESWRYQHAVHHASAGNLDGRDLGDIWTLTVGEYQASSRWQRFTYRLYRNPFIMFLVGPLFQFFIANRFYRKGATQTERRSIMRTNAAILAVLVVAWFTIGIKAYILIQLPVMWFASIFGVWLFYVQHQFEGVYWDRKDDWDYVRQALEGSSFYQLPKVLQWFSGNIGFHHVHHLSPRIPNYYLERCHREQPIFHCVKPITLRTAIRSLRYRIWDEERRELITFGEMEARVRRSA
jgi:omega-6 fatty acid desaturase (delta-12 desaturase)